MIRALKHRWHKAQALSVLQLWYKMPLREPLDPLAETDLQTVMKLAFGFGGTPFDTAISFMILRADNAIRFHQLSEDDTHLGTIMGVGFATRDRMKLWDQHHQGIKRLAAMLSEAKNAA